MRNFRNYDFWQDSKCIVRDIYRLCEGFPHEERYALCDQLKRAAVSIPSNIAEGSGRSSEADFAHFLDVALGSAYEVETQLEIAYDTGYITIAQRDDMIERLQSIEKRITSFGNTLRNERR